MGAPGQNDHAKTRIGAMISIQRKSYRPLVRGLFRNPYKPMIAPLKHTCKTGAQASDPVKAGEAPFQRACKRSLALKLCSVLTAWQGYINTSSRLQSEGLGIRGMALPSGSNAGPLVMTYFLLRDCNIRPKKELHSSLWVASVMLERLGPVAEN